MSNNTTIIHNALNNTLGPNYQNLTQPEEILLFLFTLDKKDAEMLRNAYLEAKGMNNETNTSKNQLKVDVISMYLYTQNRLVLGLPQSVQ